MKHILSLFTIIFCAVTSFSQENTRVNLLTSDASWGKEIISMPIHFAPQIPYKGVEEIRFAPNWSKQGKDDFWSYVFVWDINLNKELTATDLETYMQYYFDGLMRVVNKEKEKKLPKTVALFIKKEKSTNGNEFIGKLQIYNAFHTKDVMLLHCAVTQYYCPKKQKSIVVFRFSPKEFEHTVWNELNAVQLTKKPCEG
ncbi:hypothetical protein U8527_00480 [Kordia algicida OT-1]|uniref:Uncharacterized protein n=1 Tax=Kordia algicida OT-1 TaxID=391587 RepID=A9DRA5_9FLAO|nr:hypothetical protein [Kordia algicida]EDP96765.1 hypothetical protein KAOT1_16418 [Kordia algicida OT-1]